MVRGATLGSSARRSSWAPILALWGAAVLLSAVQIYVRELARGMATPWLDVFIANFLAWLPWLLIAPLALECERCLPVAGPPRWRNLGLHALVGSAVSVAFLFYLTLFHLLYLEGHALPIGAATLRDEYTEKVGQFFVACVLLYAATVTAGFALRSWRVTLQGRRQVAAGRQPTSDVQTATPEPVTDAPTPTDGESPGPFVIRSIGRVEKVDPAEVHWIEGCGNYARLHLDGRSVLLRRTLSALAEELEPARFARVHRSAIVNVDRIARLDRRSHGEATVVLQGGHQLKVSRTYRPALERRCF